jgi:Tfp pilus assembly protein PilN
MTEVDLIPEDYRQLMQLRRGAKSFVIAFGIVLLLIGCGKGMLNSLIAMEKAAIATLENGKSTITAQRVRLEKLQDQQADLEQRLTILESLQGGPPVAKIFVIIDRAVNDTAWFTGLKLRRLPAGPGQTATGNSVVSIKGGGRDKAEPGNDQQQGRMRMEISGQALNHSALADLVKRLLAQQEIDDVHIINTSTLQYPAGQVVAYNLVVIINAREQEQRES